MNVKTYARMAAASKVFDEGVTPVILPHVMGLRIEDRDDWWAGFLSSTVGAMAASMGEKKAQDACKDLFTRAKDFAADQAKVRG